MYRSKKFLHEYTADDVAACLKSKGRVFDNVAQKFQTNGTRGLFLAKRLDRGGDYFFVQFLQQAGVDFYLLRIAVYEYLGVLPRTSDQTECDILRVEGKVDTDAVEEM